MTFKIYLPDMKGHNSYNIEEFDSLYEATLAAKNKIINLKENYILEIHDNGHGYQLAYLINKQTNAAFQYSGLDKGITIFGSDNDITVFERKDVSCDEINIEEVDYIVSCGEINSEEFDYTYSSETRVDYVAYDTISWDV